MTRKMVAQASLPVVEYQASRIKYVAFLVLVFAVSSCGLYTSISKINREPQKYQGKRVLVKGKVVETLAIPFVQKGMYKIDDGTGKIWIMSEERVPFRGEKVTVEGRVKIGLAVGERTFGTVIAEGE